MSRQLPQQGQQDAAQRRATGRLRRMPITIDKRVKKKDGVSRYRVRVSVPDSHGNTRQIERLVWGKAEALQMEQQIKTEYDGKRAICPKITVGDLFKQYAEYHAIDTKRSSHETAMKRLRLWVLPYFGDKRIDKLTQKDFVDWKVKINGESLSYVSKRNIYCAFVAMLNYAVKAELISKNQLSVLGNFKDSNVQKTPETLHYYTIEQFERFITAAKSDCKTITDWGFYVFFCIAFFTGARKGEINALRWSDIDGKILHIRRSVTQKLKGGDVETSPKNKSSIRDLQLPEPLIKVLNEHKQRLQEAANDSFSESKYICGYDRPLRDTSIDKRNRKYAETAGLPHIKIHDFRHSHVSLLANEGINIQEIARRLGHANVQETWNTYCHLYPREEERAVEILNKISTGEKTQPKPL